jgi:hypothetical protein
LFILYALDDPFFAGTLPTMPSLDNERALWMSALTGNFYILAPRLTARLAAVLLAVRNIAAAGDVRAFLALLVYHDNSFD